MLSAVSRHPLHSCQIPRRRVLCLSPTALPCLGACPNPGSGAVQVSYSPKNPNPGNSDNAFHVLFQVYMPEQPSPCLMVCFSYSDPRDICSVMILLQIGRTTQDEAALVYLFAQMASRPCFYQVRQPSLQRLLYVDDHCFGEPRHFPWHRLPSHWLPVPRYRYLPCDAIHPLFKFWMLHPTAAHRGATRIQCFLRSQQHGRGSLVPRDDTVSQEGERGWIRCTVCVCVCVCVCHGLRCLICS